MRAIDSRWTRLLLGVAFALGAAGTLAAAEHVKLKDGTILKGQATDYDSEKKILFWRTDDGRDVFFQLAELDQRSVYLVTRSQVPRDSAEGQLKIANYARDIGLWAHSARHYRWATQADPALKPEVDREVAIMHQQAAAWGMEQVQAAIAKNDIHGAEKWLKRIIEKLPDEPQAKQAGQMLDEYYTKVHAARTAELDAKNQKLLESQLQKPKMYYDRMVKRTKDGLVQKSTGSKSVRDWENAAKDGERALKELDKVAKKFPAPDVQELVAGYRKHVIDQIIETRMHLASHYMTRTSFNRASSEVNKSLALDPKSEAALSMRARIEQASSRGLGWW